MRLLPIALVGVLSLLLASSLRADFAHWLVTPKNVDNFRDLKVEATADPSGVSRFVVRREGDTSKLSTTLPPDVKRPPYVKGILRLKGAEDVRTEAHVVPTTKPDAVEYRFAVAPSHLDIASFHIIEDQGPVGGEYEIPLKAFAPKAESTSDPAQP